ncbi:hypothetical protein WCLP8_4520007 [uncultured Gammaproteobacteria bacterium]
MSQFPALIIVPSKTGALPPTPPGALPLDPTRGIIPLDPWSKIIEKNGPARRRGRFSNGRNDVRPATQTRLSHWVSMA